MLRPGPLARPAVWLLLTTALLVAAAGSARAERVRVALLPVVVHSSESSEYLQNGLADMLVARLGRDPRIAVIEVSDEAAATTDVQAARAAARGEGAAWVVFGSFTRFGEGASLDLQCAPVQGKADPHKLFAQAASLGALIPMLEGVSERVAGHVLGGAGDTPPVAAGPVPAAGGGELVELRRRVEALERAVDALGAARMPQEAKPPTVQMPGSAPGRE